MNEQYNKPAGPAQARPEHPGEGRSLLRQAARPHFTKDIQAHLLGILLPVMLATYPILFLYGNNARILNPGILVFPLVSSALAAGLAYCLFALFLSHRPSRTRRAVSASLSAAAFVVLFYLYGFAYQRLVKLDRFPVEHFTLLPISLVLAGYAGYGIAHVRPAVQAGLQKILLVVSAALLAFNAIIILPVELKKDTAATQGLLPVTNVQANPGDKYPDIYYIIFDEYVGFDAMREYWHDNSVNVFESYLKQNGFFIAKDSRSPTINTTSEMASRLNFHQYAEKDDPNMLMAQINNNKAMQILKAHGYTTVSINMFYPDIKADYNFKIASNQVGGLAPSEFTQTYLSDTMLSAVSGFFVDSNQTAVQQRDMINYALDKTVNQDTIPSPKFIYTHLLLPHTPFIFDKDGNLLPPQTADDWHYYQGQYQYATKRAMQLVQDILANADSDNPPVIILQSDEGARNLQSRTKDNIVINGYLENYPAQYNQYILNALLLPGMDTSKFPSNMPPIDALATVLNHYLNAGVKVDKYKP